MHLPTDDKYSVIPQPEIRRQPRSGRVLCFAPHPDDEIAGPGGTLGLHRQQGDPVRIVLASDGIEGDPDGRFDKATYGQRRRQESRDGMAHLGVHDFRFWGFPDSCVITDNDVNQVAGLAVRELDDFAPNIVYLPWEGEGNSDHRALYCGVLRGLRRSGFSGLAYGYEIWNAMVPDLIVDITEIAERKWAGMEVYLTQLSYVEYIRPVRGMNAHRSMIFNKGRGYGEAFRLVQVAPDS